MQRLFGCVVLATLVPGVGAPASPQVAGDGWTRHTFTNHGFSIEAPAEPSSRMGQAATPYGPAPTEMFHMARPGVQGMLSVGISTLPYPAGFEPNKDNALLEAATTAIGGGEALSNEAMTIDGHPARRVKFSNSRNFGDELGPVSGEMLIIFVGRDKLYQVGGIHRNGDAERARITARFIDSFRFEP